MPAPIQLQTVVDRHDELGTAKSKPAHRLRQFIWVADEAKVYKILICSIVLPNVAFA